MPKKARQPYPLFERSVYDFPWQELDNFEDIMAFDFELTLEKCRALYRKGCFPWYQEDEDDCVLWWHPRQRAILKPQDLKISHSWKPLLKRVFWDILDTPSPTGCGTATFYDYRITRDQDFKSVIQSCKDKRSKGRESTWINDSLVKIMKELHAEGLSQSYEVWDRQNNLVGGLYGVRTENFFMGESMFSHVNHASKLALWALCHDCKTRNEDWVDCQVMNPHLASLGATLIDRGEYLRKLVGS